MPLPQELLPCLLPNHIHHNPPVCLMGDRNWKYLVNDYHIMSHCRNTIMVITGFSLRKSSVHLA